MYGDERQKKYDSLRSEVNAKLTELQKPLNELAGKTPGDLIVYQVVNEVGWSKKDTELWVPVFPEDHPSHYKKIRVYVTLKGVGSSWFPRDYKAYVRIESDHWDISFKKNWTFETKDLVAKIHAKIQEMVRQLEYKYNSGVETQKTEEALREFLDKRFDPQDTKYVTGPKATVYTKYGKVVYNINDDRYYIELEGLTSDQLNSIIEIKKQSEVADEVVEIVVDVACSRCAELIAGVGCMGAVAVILILIGSAGFRVGGIC